MERGLCYKSSYADWNVKLCLLCVQGGNCVGGSVDEIPGGYGTCEKGEIFFLILFLVVYSYLLGLGAVWGIADLIG